MSPQGFYVYQLVDPRNGLPFYVGKGQKRRAWQHEIDVRRGDIRSNSRKCEKIREIIQNHLSVEVRIVAEYEAEEDALDHEYRLVDASPTLTNIAEGGIGKVASPKMLRRRQEALSKRLAKQRILAKEAARARDIERRKQMAADYTQKLKRVANDEGQQREIEAWASRLPKGIVASLRPPSDYALRAKNREAQAEVKKRKAEAEKSGFRTDPKFPGMSFPVGKRVGRQMFRGG